MPRRKFDEQERSWLDQIHADPRNDALRHAYADWLVQRNDSFGEFIRLTQRRADLRDGLAEGNWLGFRASLWLSPRFSRPIPDLDRVPADVKKIRIAWSDHERRHWRRSVRPLPEVLAFDRQYDLRGFPCVDLHRPTLDSAELARKEGSPRHFITLHVDPAKIEELPAILEHPVMARTHEIVLHNQWQGEADYTESFYTRLSEMIARCPYVSRLYAVTFPRPSRASTELIRNILGPLTAIRF
jgi:uncharacterized protein (TIGR02996 family)